MDASNTNSQNTQSVATTEPPKPKTSIPFKTIGIVAGAVLLLGIIIFTIFNLVNKKETATQGGEIVWWGLWEDDTIVKPIIADYEAKNPNIKIKYVKQSKEDYRERLTTALAKGTGPDIFRFHNTWTPMFKSELDKVPSSVYSTSDFSNTFYPVQTSDLSIGGSLVGVPLEYDGLTLFMNEEIFEKAGKGYPTTWNELRQIARELTIKDETGQITQAGVALGRTENVDHWPEILGLMMFQNGVDLNKPTGKLAEDALDFYTIFSKDDEVWDESLPNSTVFFASNKLALYFGPSWRAFEIRLQNPNLRFRAIPMVQPPKDGNEPDVNYASYWAEGVWTKSKNKTNAWNFLKYLSSKEVLEKLYNNASKTRMFGEPYPRQEMEIHLKDHPIVGSTLQGAKTAQTRYLQSRTWDGPTGINSQITKYLEDAVNIVNTGKEAKVALETVSSGVIQVLSQYGIKVQ